MNKPSLPKGTRDFIPETVLKRRYITQTISNIYEQYGFLPIETPALENLSTLTGKYGAEGDQLLFKILNSGDYLNQVDEDILTSKSSKKLLPLISEKGLRYDLTVPLARFVVMNQHVLTFPFKRYQLQPVWRADRPQKGRYREFWQCDADIIGSYSISNEIDLICIIDEVFTKLGLRVQIQINHRQLLEAIADSLQLGHCFQDFVIAIDKLDKIGQEGVIKELKQKQINTDALSQSFNLLNSETLDRTLITNLLQKYGEHEKGKKGIADLKEIADFVFSNPTSNPLVFNPTLARGLDYYTGCIFEITALDTPMGSISGGGRYDNLTENFGVNNMPGVGISFGIDRIYDVMETLNLFPNKSNQNTHVLWCHFDIETKQYAMHHAHALRKRGISCEVYPDIKKLPKQLEYADKKQADYVIICGENEMNQSKFTLRNMKTKASEELDFESICQKLKA